MHYGYIPAKNIDYIDSTGIVVVLRLNTPAFTTSSVLFKYILNT
jgi:hypothetical protein